MAQLTKQKTVANSENDDESDDVTTNTSEEKTTSHRIEAEISFEKPNPFVDRIPAKQPKFEKKGKGEDLTSPGGQLANLTTIKLSRKGSPRTSSRKCVESVHCKVHPELFILTTLDPTHKEWI